jgi:hypothetical protein
MAASMLKTLGFWLEEQLSDSGHPTLRALVLAALDDFIRAGVAPPSRLNSPDTSSLSSGPAVGEFGTLDPSAHLFDEGRWFTFVADCLSPALRQVSMSTETSAWDGF